MQPATSTQLVSVTMLRGLASLAVCWMHFTGTVPGTILAETGRYGGFGVHVFFVISGFIIPYSLYHSNYKLHNYFKFLLKRILRLDPPYLASILLIFILAAVAKLSPYYSGSSYQFLSINTVYHLFYVADIFDGKWYNTVFWTLAIEFQFYLFIGLFYPIITNKNQFIKIICIAILVPLPFLLTDKDFVFRYMLLFLPGLLLFLYMTKQLNRQWYIISSFIVFSLNYFISDWGGVIACILAVVFILFVEKPVRPLLFLGAISYSLYLIHLPFGADAFINFLQNYITGVNGRILLIFIALPVTIFGAWLFYKFIEQPSIRLSKKIRY